eukprot:6197172-Pleurochrysis_carterae.AAC.1
MMKTKTIPFEALDVQLLSAARNTLTYPYYPGRLGYDDPLTRPLAPSYLNANGEASKKYILDLAVARKSEKASFSNLEAWAVNAILRTRFYGESATAEAVRSKFKSLLRNDGNLARL